MTTDRTSLIGIDWGTSSCRIVAINDNGTSSAVIDDPNGGISKFSSGDFGTYLESQLQKIEGITFETPVLIAGMIGSNIGWEEVPYHPAPIDPVTLAGAIHTIQKSPRLINIVPGISQNQPQPDVMRGEETQIVGWLAQAPEQIKNNATLCLPGTHSKWVDIKSGTADKFRTYLTGELYALLCQHSILVKGEQKESEQAFENGIKYIISQGSILASLFSTRVAVLTKDMAPFEAASYLSGLLIATEIAEQKRDSSLVNVALIGHPRLCNRYQKVLSWFQIEAELYNGTEMATRGLHHLWSCK